MKHLLLIILGALCSVPSVTAKDRIVESNIHGHVIEKQTGEHIPYLFINLKGEALAIRAQRYAGLRKASLLSSVPNRIPCRKESQFTTISSTKSQADTAGLRKAM